MTKSASPDGASPPSSGKTMPPARDPKIAVEEEYELARRRGTADAWELFIRRHPDDPLAAMARRELERLRK